MRILYLSQRVPYPPDRGDKITTCHQVRHLAERHAVTVACLADGRSDLDNIPAIEQWGVSVHAVLLSPWRSRLRAALAIGSGEPLTVAYFREPKLHARVRALTTDEQFDVVIAYSSSMAQFVEHVRDVPRIMQFADLDSQKWQQYADRSAGPMRGVYSLEARRLLRYERHLANTFSHSVLCTPRELRDFERIIPGAKASCIPNGVDLESFQPVETEVKSGLVFTGVMDYRPNVDGVIWFCREVLPLVRAEVPDVTFTICGARPNRAVQMLERLPGVTVTGRVPDVRPYLARAAVGVVPLRMARGIQNKLLEAMAMGLATVATTSAFDGVEAVRDTDLLVADEPEEFAKSAVRLLRDNDLRRRIGCNARSCVERNYSWGSALARLDDLLVALTSDRLGCVPS